MKAYITVDRLRLRAFHGVMPQERTVGNAFEISMRFEYPPALDAVTGDDLSSTINYARLVDIAKSVMAKPANLLEHIAGRIHQAVIAEYPQIAAGTITVAKIAPPIAAELSAAKFTLEF